jgi:hypothetical protein
VPNTSNSATDSIIWAKKSVFGRLSTRGKLLLQKRKRDMSLGLRISIWSTIYLV